MLDFSMIFGAKVRGHSIRIELYRGARSRDTVLRVDGEVLAKGTLDKYKPEITGSLTTPEGPVVLAMRYTAPTVREQFFGPTADRFVSLTSNGERVPLQLLKAQRAFFLTPGARLAWAIAPAVVFWSFLLFVDRLGLPRGTKLPLILASFVLYMAALFWNSRSVTVGEPAKGG